MGTDIDKEDFASDDYVAFSCALERNLVDLGKALATPGFGVGAPSLGAELEMYIVDAAGNPLYVNQDILSDAGDPQLTLELNRYNLEYNLSPYSMHSSPFVSTEREILEKLQSLRSVAQLHGGRIVPIGILPTLTQADFGSHCITDKMRYHALVSQLIKRRGNEFQIDINGEDPLKLQMEDITLEGANTSFQVHYRVNPSHYADTFNAIQLMTPLAVAIGANSPTLFGHSLWHETRIPLFKQSIDTRHIDRYNWNEPARVNFGHGWVRRGPEELFSEAVRLYPPLLPICPDHEPDSDGGSAPSLAELRLHQSTVWLWNRPVYDNADGGHLRIEMRALPAGPTAIDMVANAAFLIGLAEGIRPRINELLPALPFHIAEYNFYRAAQSGLGAHLVWPRLGQSGCVEQSVSTIIEEMLPCAQQGLDKLGLASEESSRYLSVIEARLQCRQTGSVWQRKRLAQLKGTMPLDNALHQMLEDFMVNSESNTPVSQWSL
jgi:gamma-glutamyl:cysteine ligase YbdK (ATP-grasp superfamily)